MFSIRNFHYFRKKSVAHVCVRIKIEKCYIVVWQSARSINGGGSANNHEIQYVYANRKIDERQASKTKSTRHLDPKSTQNPLYPIPSHRQRTALRPIRMIESGEPIIRVCRHTSKRNGSTERDSAALYERPGAQEWDKYSADDRRVEVPPSTLYFGFSFFIFSFSRRSATATRTCESASIPQHNFTTHGFACCAFRCVRFASCMRAHSAVCCHVYVSATVCAVCECVCMRVCMCAYIGLPTSHASVAQCVA